MVDWDWLWVAGELGCTILLHQLWKNKDAFIAVLEASPDLKIDDLKNFSSSTSTIDFATVHGVVKPLDSSPNSTFKSQFLPNIIGVIYRLTMKERKIERDRQTWNEKKRLINDVTHYTDFRLVGPGGNHIVIKKPGAFDDILQQLEVIHVKFEPNSSSAASKLIDALAGNITTGIETKERMLLPDVALTGVGRLKKQGRIWILVPHERWGGILTRSSRKDIIDGHRSIAGFFYVLRNICLVAAGVTISYLLYRYYKRHGDRWRSNRPANHTVQPAPVPVIQHNDNINDDGNSRLRCIICLENEITRNLQPCSHLGLCEGCVVQLQNRPTNEQRCPICRGSIENYQRIFLP